MRAGFQQRLGPLLGFGKHMLRDLQACGVQARCVGQGFVTHGIGVAHQHQRGGQARQAMGRGRHGIRVLGIARAAQEIAPALNPLAVHRVSGGAPLRSRPYARVEHGRQQNLPGQWWVGLVARHQRHGRRQIASGLFPCQIHQGPLPAQLGAMAVHPLQHAIASVHRLRKGRERISHRHHHSARAFQQMGHGVAVVQITRNESTAVKMHHQGRRMTRLLAAIHAHCHRFTACQIDGAVYTARSGRLRLGRGCCWVGLRGGTRCGGRHGDGL